MIHGDLRVRARWCEAETAVHLPLEVLRRKELDELPRGILLRTARRHRPRALVAEGGAADAPDSLPPLVTDHLVRFAEGQGDVPLERRRGELGNHRRRV